MKKRPIPNPRTDQIAFNTAVKENLEQIMGQRGDAVQELSSSATTAEIIAKINEIVERLQ